MYTYICIYIYISTEPENKLKASETGHTLQRAVGDPVSASFS